MEELTVVAGKKVQELPLFEFVADDADILPDLFQLVKRQSFVDSLVEFKIFCM